MNYQTVEDTIKAGYREVTTQYRRDDEIEVTTEHHRRVSALLREICDSFPHPINVLDVGCGTGRYFHCLTNVKELTGMDITEEMLRAAESPVREEQVSARGIRLIRSNVYLASFPPESFHLIYSLGMFGNGCPVTVELCNKFHSWLVPGGKIFFNTVDIAGLPVSYRARRQARQLIYPILSSHWQKVLDKREARHPFFSLTKRQLEGIMRQTEFAEFSVASYVCASPLWSGRHLECLATKGN